jgi:hypothetical protein
MKTEGRHSIRYLSEGKGSGSPGSRCRPYLPTKTLDAPETGAHLTLIKTKVHSWNDLSVPERTSSCHWTGRRDSRFLASWRRRGPDAVGLQPSRRTSASRHRDRPQRVACGPLLDGDERLLRPDCSHCASTGQTALTANSGRSRKAFISSHRPRPDRSRWRTPRQTPGCGVRRGPLIRPAGELPRPE